MPEEPEDVLPQDGAATGRVEDVGTEAAVGAEGEEELGTNKLPDLLDLKYGSPTDAVRELGSVADIRSTFTGFQKGLYEN